MRKQIALVALAWSLFGAVQLPASADTVWFKTYDTNADGLWSYPEFVKAQEQYILVHPQATRVTTTELRRQFDGLDVDHSGFVKMEQVRTYHDW
jgi:hypothetical protein